jgi:IS5 family transposase
VVCALEPGGRRCALRVGSAAALYRSGSGPRAGAGRDHDLELPPSAEEYNLGGKILDTVNHYLASRGVRITTGTIVDAAIIHAPSSTKNEKKERDPAMHQTRKGNQCHLGVKAHIGVDSKEGIVHSVCSTAASVSDVPMLPELLHGDEKKVWGDAGYQGQTEAIHAAAPQAQDMTSKRVKTKAGVDQQQKRKNRTKARVRAKVEWPFRVLERVSKIGSASRQVLTSEA